MSYILVIVESPAKCNKIESYLGEGYKCVASFGHIRELAPDGDSERIIPLVKRTRRLHQCARLVFFRRDT